MPKPETHETKPALAEKVGKSGNAGAAFKTPEAPVEAEGFLH